MSDNLGAHQVTHTIYRGAPHVDQPVDTANYRGYFKRQVKGLDEYQGDDESAAGNPARDLTRVMRR